MYVLVYKWADIRKKHNGMPIISVESPEYLWYSLHIFISSPCNFYKAFRPVKKIMATRMKVPSLFDVTKLTVGNCANFAGSRGSWPTRSYGKYRRHEPPLPNSGVLFPAQGMILLYGRDMSLKVCFIFYHLLRNWKFAVRQFNYD